MHVDDGDVVTGALQQQRRGETADPGADDCDVDGDITGERCVGRRICASDPDGRMGGHDRRYPMPRRFASLAYGYGASR